MSKRNSIQCAQCGGSTTTAELIPKFCSHCGARFETIVEGLGTSGSTNHPAASRTMAAQGVLANSDSISLDETQDSSFVIKAAGSANKLRPGDQVGPFRLGCVLGAGGMGTVYEAHDTENDFPVALKILSKQVHATSEGIERFRRESQVAASINHPGSTFVYRSGKYGEQFFIAMELMNGGTLKDVIEQDGPLEFARAVDFMIQAIDGLAVAHQVGIVHRDFKPSNCFVDDDGKAKVGDFGLAKNFFGDVALTQTGTFVGTPQFAAPEQLRAGHVDARTDIYAVGGTLFYLLTGRAPFVGDAAQVISGIAAEQAPNVKTIAPHIPEKLASLLAAMLEKDPARRPGSLEEIRVALMPFSSLGAVPPDNGQRMAAFFIDTIIFGFVGFLISLVLSPLHPILGPWTANLIVLVSNFVALIGWFTTQEYVLGTTIGKWLFRMRVINEQNESPRLWQALVRPMLIPGTRWLLALAPVLVFHSPQGGESMTAQDITNVGVMYLVSILSWIPCLLMMLTAKISNGYRGMHDLLTGTRVVRISSALQSCRIEDQPVTAPIDVNPGAIPPNAIEPFRILGYLGSAGKERILVGEDPELDRKVWIYETENPAPPLTRASIRPTRQRIIASRSDESSDPARHWFVAESIEGMPLLELIESVNKSQWTTFRPLLRELAAELEDACEENSLPENFRADNVWLDQSGQLKLVEISTGNESSSMEAREVFDLIFAKVVALHPVPEHVIELSNTWRKDNSIPMSEIVRKLDELVEKPATWSWIDRVGTTCVSLAIEMTLLFLLAQMWLSLCENWFTMSITSICAWFVVLMMVLAFFVGYFFQNPSFWFLGVAIRKRDKQTIPSRFRRAMRTSISWLLPVLLATSIIGIQSGAVHLNETMSGQPPIEFLVVVLMMPATALAMFVVSVFNLCYPSRGLADLICGTLLMRK